MKNTFLGFMIPLLLTSSFFIPQQLYSQFTVTPIKAGKGQEAAGFYYALPRNYVKVDFIVERNQRFKGPYADYSSRILGVNDFVKQDEVQYTLLDVIISVHSEPDPNAYYFVEFDERGSRDVRSLVFSLQPDGIIIAADDAEQGLAAPGGLIEKTFVNAPDKQRFHYFAERNLYQRIDTLVRRITIDTTVIRRNILQSSWVDRNPEQKARAAADQIHKIREARYNLISGFQEINYGTSIVYMDRQLLDLENEYLSLFIGKEVRSIEEQSFYFLPEKGKSGLQPFVKFSDASGVVDLSGRGESIQVRIEPVGNTELIAPENRNAGNTRLSNSMYYRLPEYADVSVVYKNNVWARQRMPISQLGVLSIAPMTRSRLVFDPETGSIRTVKRD